MPNDKRIMEGVDSVTELRKKIARLEEENHILRDKLVQVSMERAEYLQNVSHQLVAPLNAIKWHIENLTEARVGYERARKVLKSIYSQATIAVHLAKNFNLMSNLEADHALTALKEPLQEVKLYRLLINLADDFQPLAWEKDIRIEVTRTQFETAPAVLAMRPLISQVFSNIIENAVKYSKPFTEILIDGNHNPQADTVVVRIRNSGITLPSEDCARIFDRGFRRGEAKSLYPAGTGFGLYIAKRIVEIHEGSIRAQMDEAGGVIFTVELTVCGLEGKARKLVR